MQWGGVAGVVTFWGGWVIGTRWKVDHIKFKTGCEQNGVDAASGPLLPVYCVASANMRGSEMIE